MICWLIDSLIIWKWLLSFENYPNYHLVILFVLKSNLSDIGIATLAFFWLALAWCVFSHSLLLTFLCLHIMLISWRQCIVESGFLNPINHWHLIGVLRPFTFNKTTYLVSLSVMPWYLFCLSLLFFVPFFWFFELSFGFIILFMIHFLSPLLTRFPVAVLLIQWLHLDL